MATLIQIRRDSQANWVSNDPVLALGEMAYSTDQQKLKVGNGSSSWSELSYINALPSEISGLNTDEISEGTTNLYFTNQRAIDAVAGGDFNTDVVEEGTTNLYFTSQRAVDAVTQGDVDTDDIEEGTTNLYYTDTRVENVISASETDDISEGTQNLYFTESRSRSSISGSTGIIYSSTDGVIYVDTDEISTVAYVNATAEGLHVHTSVATATTENITNLSSPPATIDGVTLTEEMRVLVKDQTSTFQNGIYVVDAGALVRAEDYDGAGDILPGDFVFVTGGTTQEATGWVQTETVTTPGTDAVVWTQFIGAGVYTAGTGLDLDGSVFILDATTDLVTEGTTNLYFTDQRAIDAVIDGAVDTDDIEEGTTNLYYTDARVEDVIAASDTDDISEGTLNLYFTDQRAIDAVANGTFTTDVVEEGTTNLYFTAQRAVDAVTDGDVDTDDISEGTTNLYFTNQKAIDAVVENIAIADLSDVASTAPNNGELLMYSSSSSSWAPVAVIDGGTP